MVICSGFHKQELNICCTSTAIAPLRKWNMNRTLILFAIVAVVSGCQQRQTMFPQGTWHDLSYDFSEETIYWPTADTFKREKVFYGLTELGYFYSANNFSAAEHGGTHLDSPIHFSSGRITADKIPLERLIGPGVIVDVSKPALADRDYLISRQDIESWEAKHGRIGKGMIVLLKTGYGKFYPDRMKYMGTDELGPLAVKKLHFPGLHPDAASFLAKTRQIKAVGIDTPSIDRGQSAEFKTHQILAGEDIPIFENVAHLDGLPSAGIFVVALPMKIKDGSGGPLRIAAFVPR
jgi:kynurenine formamidase